VTPFRLGPAGPGKPLKLRVRELREARGLSVGELAARAGCNPMTITRLEAGQSRPNRADLERYAAALGVTQEELLAVAPSR
jgi:transcriptional regulator with XRE-family HTH domain